MSIHQAKQAYEMYGRVKKAEETAEHIADMPGNLLDSAGNKANDLFGLRRGELKGRLTVFIRDGDGIEGNDGFLCGGADPYVIINLDDAELGRTSVDENGAENPTWNEVFTFEVDGEYEDLAFHVLDKDIDSDDHLGVAVVSAKSIYKKRVIEGNFPLKKATVKEIAATNGDDVELQPVPKGEKAEDSTGSLNFRVEYHPPRFEGKLEFEIFNAVDLYNADGGGFMSGVSDPYVKIMIDDDKVAHTKTVKNELSPVWNETKYVSVTGEHTNIFLVVLDDDHTSCDENLGHVKISAAELMEKNEITETRQLQPKPGSKDEGKIHGTLSYRIKHTPPQLDGTITATVIEATNLADMDSGLFKGKSDPYTILSFDDKEMARTKTIDNTKNPEWNEELGPIPVTGEVKAIKFVVMDCDEGETDDDHLGTVTFGAEQVIMDRTIQGKFSVRAREGDKAGKIRGSLTVTLNYEPNE